MNGAWVQRELSDKRVHVYSNFTFIERMVLDSLYYCVYIFVYNILSEVNLHHRMPAETNEEWTKKESVDQINQTYFSA